MMVNQCHNKSALLIPTSLLKISLLYFTLSIANPLSSQDHHLSNYGFAPLTLNAAECGNFRGNLRIGGAMREQWRTFIEQPFQTGLIYIDGSMAGLRETDWISGGAQIVTDRSGALSYLFNEINPSIAYHLGSKQSANYFSIGGGISFYQRQLGNGQLQLGDELAGQIASSPDRIFLEDYSELQRNFHLGLSYAIASKQRMTTFGISLQNLTSPTSDNVISRRWNAALSTQSRGKQRVLFRWSLYASFQSTAYNIIGKADLTYKLSKDSNTKLGIGLGYRYQDALLLSFEYSKPSWAVAFTYDATISSARKYNAGVGAFELSAYKIITLFRKPEVTPILLCPRL